ncbi:MAG: SMP-30/gluconolactonase/LRE family protein [Rhizobiales bacterium]|nr:SMP-30/gluconolactonase/LRE family protein [Hyphomicrobiales bacterium]
MSGYGESCALAMWGAAAFDGVMKVAELWIRSHHRLGESIIWHAASRKLMWVDLLDPALFVHDLTADKTARHGLPLQPPIGSIAATTDPKRLIIAHRQGLSLLHLDAIELESFCDPEAGRDAIIYNDIKADRWGRLWVGTSHAKEQEPRGALWCVKDRKTWALADAGFAIANGPAFSRDGRTLYFNDSAGRMTFAYEIDGGSLLPRGRRILRHFGEEDGMPDGVAVDSGGNIWCAQWNGAALICLTESGDVLQRAEVAAYNVTALCFGGDELRDVYVTTATDGASAVMMERYPLTGSLFKLRASVPGLLESLFEI